MGATVTYGDRVEYVVECVQSMYAAGVQSVVIVTNGINEDVRRRLSGKIAGLAVDGKRVEFLHLDANYGPGVGFGIALEAAAEHSPDWVLLLDDDNVIEDSGGAELAQWITNANSSSFQLALCHRPLEKWQVDSIQRGEDANPGPGSVLYFDLIARVSRRFRARPRRHAVKSIAGRIGVSMAPFGGLVLSRRAIVSVEPPRRDMTLYEEDSEYVDRLIAAGFSIELLCDVIVRDLDSRWSSGRRLGILDATDLMRLWVSVRNRVAIDRVRASRAGRSGRLSINIAAYLMLISATAVRRGRRAQLSTIYNAVVAGWSREPFLTHPPKQIDVDALALKAPTDVKIEREIFGDNSLGTG